MAEGAPDPSTAVDELVLILTAALLVRAGAAVKTADMALAVRLRVRVEGVVQGVGFRPFVHALASRLALGGLVGNDASGVFIEVEGPANSVGTFLTALRDEAPPLASIDEVSTSPCPPLGSSGFTIVASQAIGVRSTLVSADSATCHDCLRELADPADRRHRYPFINCTNCGPRFTITRDVPYDRPMTTMAGFAMCAACAGEYTDPADRRFHAQPVCCPACGPRLTLLGPDGTVALGLADGAVAGDPLTRAAELLREGAVLAVKGLGGFHLAADASSEVATALLRGRKHREDKPFAVMVADLEQARSLCQVDAVSESLLISRRRPIVLLNRRDDGDTSIASAVAPRNRQLGLMLPYTPLHHLLLQAVVRPIVLTSGNVTDEPIAFADTDALTRLAPIADAFLTHDRAIHVRVDDSVVRVFGGRPTMLRRSRGYAPEPVRLTLSAPRPVLACGAELKNTFCLLKGRHAMLSQHIGDLENYATFRSFTEGIEHYSRLFDIEPQVIAYDPHPEYLSTKYAFDQPAERQVAVELVAVQHHHAHIASCLADNGEAGPVIGVAFDGTGFGADHSIWGGEFLLADLVGFTRLGHLEQVPMPGGAAAIRQPWRMSVAYLEAAYAGSPPDGLAVLRRNEARWPQVAQLARKGVNAPLTSSAGRLFDAVAALIGVRDEVNYEGQAAIELEQRADPSEHCAYRASIIRGELLRLCGADFVRAAVADLDAGVNPRVIAARFHNGLAEATARMCDALRERTGVSTVALSGGVFQNLLLLERTVQALSGLGFRVLTHSRVPPNDGGISLGQAAVAAARDQLGTVG